MKPFFCLLALSSFLFSCTKNEDDVTIDRSTPVPEVYTKIYGAEDIYIESGFVVIKTTGLPDHKSPYYQNTQWHATSYEAYNGDNTGFNLNPNRISSFNYTYKIPLEPKKAISNTPTQLGVIGVSINGVPFFNQYAGPNNQPLTNEINSFDQYNGHPQQQGAYHYHVEPKYLTQTIGSTVLLGFLMDGFPIYGPIESGDRVTNDNLDAYHGHEHSTTDYPDGIYHYHITDEDPYLNGSGYYGTPGTITQ